MAEQFLLPYFKARFGFPSRLRLLCCCVLFGLSFHSTLYAETESAAASTSSIVMIDAPSALLAHYQASVVLRSNAKLESEEARNTACDNGTLHGKPCKV